MRSDGQHELAVRRELRLQPDRSRTVTRLFVAGQEQVGGGESRAGAVISRVLALDEDDVERCLRDVMTRFDRRHRNFADTLRHHADRVAHRVNSAVALLPARRLLLGAMFTHEYAIEAAALCNPSIVLHPDQREASDGAARFVMSVRGIGEGHRSSIGFRTGCVARDGTVLVDEARPFPVTGNIETAALHRDVIQGKLKELGDDGESTAFVLDLLDERPTLADFERVLGLLYSDLATRHTADDSVARLRAVASSTYSTVFSPESDISERVLWPATATESHGMEDARFVRFVEDDGRVTYYATYTAYDGLKVSQQILETPDFATFAVSPVVGAAAANKGLALFPRRIGGRYVALSRWDRETSSIATSDNIRRWDNSVHVQTPSRSWEVIQVGNCGSPIETEAGWLVLTHGVGPMRTYSIGALLLDLDDPTRVLGQLREPLLTPSRDEQDGYVPNVVYSCGALVHEDTLVLPYGIGDAAIGIATVPLGALLHRLVGSRA